MLSPLNNIFIKVNAQSTFKIYNNPSYFWCEIKQNNYIYNGLLAEIDCKYFLEKIYPHEECIFSNLFNIYDQFKKSPVQSTPILLTANNVGFIEGLIGKKGSLSPTNQVINLNNSTIKISQIINLDIINSITKYIDYFHILDGHHRVGLFAGLNWKAMALIVCPQKINTYPILRKYSPSIDRKFSLSILNNLFNCEIVHDINENWNLKDFIFFEKSEIFKIRPYSYNNFVNILSITEEIKYRENSPVRYENFPVSHNNYYSLKDITSSFNVCSGLLIPALKKEEITKKYNLLPPHSTWIEPKIPEKVINMLINRPSSF